MLIKYGFGIAITVPQPTPLITLLDVRDQRRPDIVEESAFITTPDVPQSMYRDQFGNMCRRMIAPAGEFAITMGGTIRDSGAPDLVDRTLCEVPVAELPDDVLVYLLGSRYCETDRLSDVAWAQFGGVQPGWARVEAIVDFVHRRISFDYLQARDTRTAAEAYEEGVGVCRDFAHLTIALCRALNIPARYVNGYLGDIGVPKDPAPMDFSAWCEIYLGGQWCAFDARHNKPRIGRVPVAYGRDATDVPLIHSFGQHVLKSFKIWTDEVVSETSGQVAA
ncbi:transglutaminase family protein [Hyphomicrobium sp.]|uniref:transglutaminase-like domain-containing protein n=1 Tax=Hyphomicrobium sp. TaxID=82 RepID=UPI002B507E70|nr:transglutaminase family protein [Hyphomicrobium sp.]HRN89545.1 transglutaminase family protein [Hyphomicrobium sp.]HRQ27252.1 transglutaminase family protein [Hyphomicrobium sp.]